jgi:hypothetical protein
VPNLLPAASLLPALPADHAGGFFAVAGIFLATAGFREGALVAVASVAAWIGASMAASALLSYVRPPKLKLASRRRTRPPELLGKRDYN